MSINQIRPVVEPTALSATQPVRMVKSPSGWPIHSLSRLLTQSLTLSLTYSVSQLTSIDTYVTDNRSSDCRPCHCNVKEKQYNTTMKENKRSKITKSKNIPLKKEKQKTTKHTRMHAPPPTHTHTHTHVRACTHACMHARTHTHTKTKQKNNNKTTTTNKQTNKQNQEKLHKLKSNKTEQANNTHTHRDTPHHHHHQQQQQQHINSNTVTVKENKTTYQSLKTWAMSHSKKWLHAGDQAHMYTKAGSGCLCPSWPGLGPEWYSGGDPGSRLHIGISHWGIEHSNKQMSTVHNW